MTRPKRFTIKAGDTGVIHSFQVLVYETREQMVAGSANYFPGGFPDTEQVGVFLNRSGFMTHAAPEALGRIFLNRDWVDMDTVVHECVHAALFQYECDVLAPNSRASAHLRMSNEILAELIANLAQQTANGLKKLGL